MMRDARQILADASVIGASRDPRKAAQGRARRVPRAGRALALGVPFVRDRQQGLPRR
jgi:hypothetical protein